MKKRAAILLRSDGATSSCARLTRVELFRLLIAVSVTCQHRPSPSPRQLQILPLVASGIPDKTIAGRLGISERAVRAQVEKLAATWGARSRAHLIALAIIDGQLSLETIS